MQNNGFVLLALLTSLLLLGCLGCSGSLPLTAAGDAQMKADKDPSAGKGQGVGQYADIHDQHAELSCMDCHSVMGGLMPDSAKCLSCHVEQEDHHRNWECIECHNGEGSRGDGGPPR